MTDKEFMEALLAGRSVADCHDTSRKYQLDNEGYLYNAVGQRITFFAYGRVVESEEIHITAKDVGRRVRLRDGTITIITCYYPGRSGFKVATPIDDHLIDGKSEETSQNKYDIMELLN